MSDRGRPNPYFNKKKEKKVLHKKYNGKVAIGRVRYLLNIVF